MTSQDGIYAFIFTGKILLPTVKSSDPKIYYTQKSVKFTIGRKKQVHMFPLKTFQPEYSLQMACVSGTNGASVEIL